MGAIVLFDGVCNFCNGAVNWVIERDPAGYFKFAALQSAIGRELTAKYGIDRNETDSVILLEDEKIYTYSTAAAQDSKKAEPPLVVGICIHHHPETGSRPLL